MHFRILGPLEVHSDHGVVTLGGRLPRAVLAVLLLSANQAISAERLAVGLWGEEREGATRTVHVHVSRLRRALGQKPTDAARGPPRRATACGWRLRELDAERFEAKLYDGAAASLGAGLASSRRAVVLREALGALARGWRFLDLAVRVVRRGWRSLTWAGAAPDRARGCVSRPTRGRGCTPS